MVSQDLPKGVAGKKHFLKVVAQGLGLQKPLSESGFPGFPRDIACKNHFSKVVSQELPKGMAGKKHFLKVVALALVSKTISTHPPQLPPMAPLQQLERILPDPLKITPKPINLASRSQLNMICSKPRRPKSSPAWGPKNPSKSIENRAQEPPN